MLCVSAVVCNGCVGTVKKNEIFRSEARRRDLIVYMCK